MTDQEILEHMATARTAAEDAGKIALSYFRTPMTVENKMPGVVFDPVTEADRNVETHIREVLSDRYPDHAIVGEEFGVTGEGDIRWIIDPIDGTRAFVSGVPAWGILIGLTENNRCLAGLMHQPFTGETFVGGPDGAFVHRNASTTKLEARADAELDNATIYCTHPMMFEQSEHQEAFQNLSARCRLQRFGGDCYSYCLLAHGCIDLVVEGFLQAYDIVPLVPIVERAGGVITDIDGNTPMNGGTVIAAANARLHEIALRMMNE